MPLASDLILDWIHEDGFSLSEIGWIRAQDHEFYFVKRTESCDIARLGESCTPGVRYQMTREKA